MGEIAKRIISSKNECAVNDTIKCLSGPLPRYYFKFPNGMKEVKHVHQGSITFYMIVIFSHSIWVTYALKPITDNSDTMPLQAVIQPHLHRDFLNNGLSDPQQTSPESPGKR